MAVQESMTLKQSNDLHGEFAALNQEMINSNAVCFKAQSLIATGYASNGRALADFLFAMRMQVIQLLLGILLQNLNAPSKLVSLTFQPFTNCLGSLLMDAFSDITPF
ncbi:hypothetical protein SUGI_0309930 [Cryptomeria japonica]|nr:hypothetical protein SUGI_0309930 [Cryptomeria japonica]